MIYILENEQLKVKVSSMGAELQSICRTDDGTEYLWQGDPAYWKGRSPNLFPFCGRMVEGKYRYDGREYSIPIHGFAKNSEWAVLRQKSNVLTLQLKDSDETLAMYPFRFAAELTYTLTDNELAITFILHNLDDRQMIFAVGGHPGFNVPLNKGEAFEDYYIEFDEPCGARQLCLSEACFYLNSSVPFPLEEERRISLRHELFDHDAIFLRDIAKGVTLRSAEGAHRVHMSYPDMRFLGLWHSPRTDAPYVCIEPWRGVPAIDGEINDLEKLPETERLQPGDTYRNTYTITLD